MTNTLKRGASLRQQEEKMAIPECAPSACRWQHWRDIFYKSIVEIHFRLSKLFVPSLAFCFTILLCGTCC
jgi:hypothetical protein